ncbi:MAG: LexA family transcriptional regulator [Rhizobium sp.]|nr:LexA family transcriptional regulator [Rhizobium sp.]
MTNALHDRIKQKLEELGLSEEAASLRMGTDRSYLRKLFDRPNSSPRGETLSRLAKALNTTEGWLLTGDGQGSSETPPLAMGYATHLEFEPTMTVPENGRARKPAPELPARNAMPLDVPVMGTAAGSHLRGSFQLEGGIIDYVRRPPGLMTAKDIYALFVEGTSMEPQFHPGDLIYVSPHRPAKAGDIVVVQSRNGEHSPDEATLGIFRRTTERAVIVSKHNPKADIELARPTVKAIHRVLTMNELFGV